MDPKARHPHGQDLPPRQLKMLHPGQIPEAARILAGGGLVAMPTETVYGLAGDARDDRAVASIFAAKDRPVFNPLIVHVADIELAAQYVELNDTARALAKAFWPGPMTLVLNRKPGAVLSDLVTAGNDTLAIRIPAHPVARALLREFGGPLAAPSANPSGKISPTTAAHVVQGLTGRIDAVLDGGACAVGVESTILSVDGPQARLLRPGGIAPEDIASLGLKLTAREVIDDTAPNAPGQLSSHYAPGAQMRLDVTNCTGGAYLGFGAVPLGVQADHVLNLSPSGDLTDASANLFAQMRVLDAKMGGQGVIHVAPIPERGLGLAINDRLRRAAAPRGQS